VCPIPLGDQLRALRKGGALLDSGLRQRIGPDLAGLCSIQPGDDLATVRARVASTVEDLLADAPDDVRRAVLVALAVEPDAWQSTLTARRDWLAQTVPCDVRTVRRHEDRGFDLAAAAAGRRGGPSARPAADWHVRTFRALLRFDQGVPRLIEERTVVARYDELDTLVAALSLPAQPTATESSVLADVLFGAKLRRTEMVSTSHLRFFLELPRRFRAGEEHQYGIAFTINPPRRLEPHYAFVPLQPCAHFEVRVRFHPSRVPSKVWRLDGVPPRLLQEPPTEPELLAPDPLGDLRLAFEGLVQGYGYGLAWEFDG
jgi:hypothetical protein